MTATRSRSRAEEREYARAVRRLRAYGQWEPWADAAPVRQHLMSLRAAGVGPDQAAALAGVSASTVTRITYGEPGRAVPPLARIRPATAARLLAVRPGPASLAPGALTGATGTRRRLQALCVLGWSGAALAALLGLSGDHVGEVMSGKRAQVTAATASAAAALYGRLQDQPAPSSTTRERISAAKARAHAARHGWEPPVAWDDSRIDDPSAQPQPWQRTGTMRAEDLVAEVEDLSVMEGYSRTQAAERLGRSRAAVDKAYERAGAVAATGDTPLCTCPCGQPLTRRSGGAGWSRTSQGWRPSCWRRWDTAGRPETGPPPPADAAARSARARQAITAVNARRGTRGTLGRSWMHAAACQGSAADFYPLPAGDAGPALAVCATCPVRRECGEWALARPEPHGIWGGMTEEDRGRLLWGTGCVA